MEFVQRAVYEYLRHLNHSIAPSKLSSQSDISSLLSGLYRIMNLYSLFLPSLTPRPDPNSRLVITSILSSFIIALLLAFVYQDYKAYQKLSLGGASPQPRGLDLNNSTRIPISEPSTRAIRLSRVD